MKRFTRIFLMLAIIVPLAGSMVSCGGESDCSIVSRATLNGLLYNMNDENVPVRFSLDSLTILALVTDSVILNREANPQYVFLPLQYTVDTTALVFRYSPDLLDTIVFKHTNTPYFVSLDCGFDMKQVVTGVYHTTHFIDSIALRDNNTNKDGNENIQIFYPAPAE